MLYGCLTVQAAVRGVPNHAEAEVQKKSHPKLERMLSLVDPSRRDALRKILLTASYVAPAVASFSLSPDANAQFTTSCSAGNQTYTETLFAGKVTCTGFMQTNGVNAQPVKLKYDDVLLSLSDGSYGSAMGEISGGPISLMGGNGTLSGVNFTGDKVDALGFIVRPTFVSKSGPGYNETGQLKRTTDPHGNQKLKGKSHVLIGDLEPLDRNCGDSYTLECDYDLKEVSPV